MEDTVSLTQLLDLREHNVPHLLIDVRDEEEWEEWHFDHAVPIPFGRLWDRMPQIAPNLEMLIITHCATGRRARWAVLKLNYIGYRNVKALAASPAGSL